MYVMFGVLVLVAYILCFAVFKNIQGIVPFTYPPTSVNSRVFDAIFECNEVCTLTEVSWTVCPALLLFLVGYPCMGSLYVSELIFETESDFFVSVYANQWSWGYEYEFSVDERSGFIVYKSEMLPLDELDFSEKPYSLGIPVGRVELGAETFPNDVFSETILEWSHLNYPGSITRYVYVDNPVILPSGSSLRFFFTSVDVMHSWSMPPFGVKMDSGFGRYNQALTFPVFTERKYRQPLHIDGNLFQSWLWGQCSEFCGTGHGFMPILLDSSSLREMVFTTDDRLFSQMKAWSGFDHSNFMFDAEGMWGNYNRSVGDTIVKIKNGLAFKPALMEKVINKVELVDSSHISEQVESKPQAQASAKSFSPDNGGRHPLDDDMPCTGEGCGSAPAPDAERVIRALIWAIEACPGGGYLQTVLGQRHQWVAIELLAKNLYDHEGRGGDWVTRYPDPNLAADGEPVESLLGDIEPHDKALDNAQSTGDCDTIVDPDTGKVYKKCKPSDWIDPPRFLELFYMWTERDDADPEYGSTPEGLAHFQMMCKAALLEIHGLRYQFKPQATAIIDMYREEMEREIQAVEDKCATGKCAPSDAESRSCAPLPDAGLDPLKVLSDFLLAIQECPTGNYTKTLEGKHHQWEVLEWLARNLYDPEGKRGPWIPRYPDPNLATTRIVDEDASEIGYVVVTTNLLTGLEEFEFKLHSQAGLSRLSGLKALLNEKLDKVGKDRQLTYVSSAEGRALLRAIYAAKMAEEAETAKLETAANQSEA